MKVPYFAMHWNVGRGGVVVAEVVAVVVGEDDAVVVAVVASQVLNPPPIHASARSFNDSTASPQSDSTKMVPPNAH